MIKQAFANGRQTALQKFALGPPTQVDQFVADIDAGKDVTPEPTQPPMGAPTALDGTMPLQLPTPPGAGASVAPELTGSPTAQPPPSMGMLGG